MSLKNLGFKISISKMVESHRETFWLIVSHPDYVGKGTLGKEAGTMTPYMSEKIDQVRHFAHEYAVLFGMSYDDVDDPFVDEYPEAERSKRFRLFSVEKELPNKK